MNWFYITLGCIVFAAFSLVYIIVSNIKFAKPAQDAKQLDRETALILLQKFITFFKDFNAEIAKTICSELFYYSLDTELRALQRVGIRKLITFKEAPSLPHFGQDVRIGDGKNNFATGLLKGEYEEKYINTGNDQVLYTKTVPVATLVLAAIQSGNAFGKEQFYCSNCGIQLKVESNYIVCPRCGTKYNTESKEWALTDVRVMNYQKSNQQTNLIALTIFAALGLSFVGKYLIPVAAHNALMLVLNTALILLTVSYYNRLNRTFKILQKIAKRDLHFSRMVFVSRIEYLINLYFKAKSYNPQLIRAFSSRELSEKLLARYSDQEVLIDLEIKAVDLIGSENVNDHQVITAKAQLIMVVVDRHKRVRRRKVKTVLKLSRHNDAKTQVFTEADYLLCDGCGASINLTADGQCKYCSNPIDLSKYDWTLVEIN